MKKFISALLVVMMLVSMLPANVFAAAETFSYDFSAFSGTSTQYAEETHALSNDVTLYMKGCHINTQLRVYGTQTGQFAIFKADSKPISGMVVNAGYKADTLVVSGSNDSGATWTELATQDVTTSYTDYTFTFAEQYKWVKLNVKGTAQVRIKTVSLTLNPAEGACTHTNTQEVGAVEPSCTATGMTATITCIDCGEVLQEGEVLPTTAHSYVDGACSVCGKEEVATDTVSLTFANDLQRTYSDAEKQIWEQDSITMTYEKGTYANDLAEYFCPIRCYQGTKITLDFVMNMTEIMFDCNSASYATAMANSITVGTVSVDSDKVTVVLPTPAKSYVVEALSAQVRIDHIYVTYEVEEGVCLHPTSRVEGYVAPTCTTEGATGTTYCGECGQVLKESEVIPVSHEGFETYTEGYVAPGCETEGATGTTYCSNCDEVVTESEVIPATGHSYVDGACENCGEAEPSDDVITNTIEEETYVFSSYTAGAQYAENEEHVLSDLVTMYTTQAHFTSQLRLYSSSSHDGYAIIKAGAPIKGIAVNAGNKVDTLVVYGSNDDGATWETAAEIAVTSTSYKDYSAAWVSTPYKWLKLDVKGTQQVRIAKMTLQFVTAAAGECTHELTEVIPGTAATCTTDGQEDSLACVCGENVQEGAVIPALGHSYDDDCCIRCATINPEAAKQAEAIDGLPQAGDQVIFYHPNDKVAMSSEFFANGAGGRMGAVSVTKANGMIPYSATHTAIMTVEQVGEYYRFKMGDQYLTADADGGDLMFAALPAEGETDYSLWNVTAAATYGVVITSVHAAYNGTNNQAIEYYQGKFYPYGYKETYISSYRIQIGLVYRKPAVVEMDGVQYSSFEEAYAYDPDTTIKLLADFEEINVTGDLYLDLNGHTVGSVTANAVFAGDSSATAEAAGTGKLTTTSEVIVDNLIGDVRYIALKGDDGAYTFHVLDLKLSNVTLRTNKAGIYYKGEMACDEVLAAQIDCHGIAVSIVGMPTADFANEANTAATKIYGAPSGVFTSGSVTNIFREGLSAEKNAARGGMAIYGNSYIQLLDGTVLMGSNQTQQSLMGIMEYLDTNYASLSAEDQANALAFYETWADAMVQWGLDNLAAAVLPSEPDTNA